jgi:hypothetical protein
MFSVLSAGETYHFKTTTDWPVSSWCPGKEGTFSRTNNNRFFTLSQPMSHCSRTPLKDSKKTMAEELIVEYCHIDIHKKAFDEPSFWRRVGANKSIQLEWTRW